MFAFCAQMLSSEIVSHYGITALPGEEDGEYLDEVDSWPCLREIEFPLTHITNRIISVLGF